MNKEELDILEELLNEEILSYINSGYSINDTYIITLRNIIKKLELKEIYNFDNYKGGNNE